MHFQYRGSGYHICFSRVLLYLPSSQFSPISSGDNDSPCPFLLSGDIATEETHLKIICKLLNSCTAYPSM